MTGSLPKEYEWLKNEPGPRMLTEALKLYGIKETQGPRNTPAIMGWARELGPKTEKLYTGDNVPWCGLFMAIVAKRAGKSLPASPLWARSWAAWAKPAPGLDLGDVLVFWRGDNAGHVGLYIGETGNLLHVLGGNQGDEVSIRTKPRSLLLAARRSYNVLPPNVRPIILDYDGTPSTTEA